MGYCCRRSWAPPNHVMGLNMVLCAEFQTIFYGIPPMNFVLQRDVDNWGYLAKVAVPADADLLSEALANMTLLYGLSMFGPSRLKTVLWNIWNFEASKWLLKVS